MNSKPQQSNPSWQPCPDGTIRTLSSAITARETAASRRQFLKSATGAAIVLSAVGVTGWSIFGRNSAGFTPNSNYPGGVACSDVISNLPAYISQSLDDPLFVEAIKVHLTECNHCQEQHECTKSQMA